MNEDQGVTASPPLCGPTGGAAVASPAKPAAANAVAYEAMVLTANLPKRTVTFIFPESGIPFAGGIFRIERIRTVTDADRSAFPVPAEEECPHCDQPMDFD